MNNKIIALVGKSASGKSTIERILEGMGYKRIISTTTRPIREKEIKDIDYHYISDEEFKQKLENNEFAENTQYRDWFYGADKSEFETDKNCVITIEPHGLKQLQESLGDRIIPIYIYVQDKERMLRSLNREVFVDVDEVVRRYQSDKELFADIEENAIYKIQNWNAHESAKVIDGIIRSESR